MSWRASATKKHPPRQPQGSRQTGSKMPKVKGLEYQANQPAFLQRLRAGQDGLGGRHERPVPRPRRAKVDDEDDAPAYVIEGTNDSVSKDDYEKMLSNGDSPAAGAEDGGPLVKGPSESTDEATVMSGALPGQAQDDKATAQARRDKHTEATVGNKKRKAATVVGQDDGDDQEPQTKVTKPTKTKKTAKAIKLSFDDD